MNSRSPASTESPYRGRRLIAVATIAALVAAQAVAIVLVSAVAGQVPTASATAGNPGTPGPGTVIFTEDFGAASANVQSTLLTSYVGTGGERYTSDPAWSNFANCNGFVLNRTSPLAANECTTGAGSPQAAQVSSAGVRALANALGQFQGQGADNLNPAVSSYTAGNPGPGIVVRSVQPIAVGATGRFLTISVLSAVENCATEVPRGNDPRYSFYLLDGATKLPINSAPLAPCGNPRYTAFTPKVVRVGQVTAPQPILWTASTAGFGFDNAQGSGAGNDAAFDHVQLKDVSPQLDKAFSPATIATGAVSQLTFTVTNTDDLFAKPGWSFTDSLPGSVRIAPTPGVVTTCGNATVTATAGAASVGVANGSLSAGQTSCTVTVNVTSATAGAFTNNASNVVSSGLLPPGSTTLTVLDTDFGDAPASYGTPTASHTATPGLTIGATRDAELSAAPTANGSGDDANGNDDEDGLTGTTSLRTNQPMTVAVPIVNTTGAAATLAGWVDFNRDGDFDDAGERTTVAVAVGATSVNLTWPAQAAASRGASFIRLRLIPGSVAAPSPTAAITGGEIEDHPATLGVPSISLTKRAGSVVETTAPTGPSAGDTITYSFDVTNNGDLPLTAVTVTDPKVTGIVCPAGALAVNATVTCTAAAHALTQTEVDAGTVHNTATASGTPPTGPAVTATSSADVTFTTVAALTLDKTASAIVDANRNFNVDPGDSISYGFSVTNVGTVSISLTGVTDPKVGAVTCPSGALAPGRVAQCTRATYTLTQADFESGGVNNTATAAATAPNGSRITGSDSTSTPITRTPRMTLTKTAFALTDLDGNGPDAGDRINYAFSVLNTGNVALNPVTVTDPKVGPVTCPSGALAPNATVTCSRASYFLTQADVDSGGVNNTATAQGTPSTGADVTSSSSTSTSVARTAAVRLVKAAGAVTDANGNGRTDAGDTISYSFAVSNAGNVTLNPVTVTDPKVGPVTCPAGALAPAATVNCTVGTYTLTASDLDAGAVNNTATASGTSPTGARVTRSSSTSTAVAGVAALTLQKTAGAPTDVNRDGMVDRGDSIRYTFRVTNSGTVTLNPVTVSDPKVGPVTCPSGALPAGQFVDCSAVTFEIPQADVDAGSVNNSAVASGTPPTGSAVTGASSTSTAVPAASSITLVKSAGPVADENKDGHLSPGDTIPYTFVVTNTGNVTLNPTRISDPKVGPVVCPAGGLAPAGQITCTSNAYALTQADIDSGAVNNTATATGVAPGGATATDDSSAATALPATASIRLVKSAAAIVDANASGRTDAGDSITYSFAVTNTGETSLNRVAVTDAKVGAVTCPSGAVAPDATVECTATPYVLTQADVDARSVTNTATVTGVSPGGESVTGTSSVTRAVAAVSSLRLVKSAGAVTDANATRRVDAGDTIAYSFAVTNTGATTLDPVAVTDAKVGAVSCPAGELAPGDFVTCSAAAYVLTQADVDSGAVNNTAASTGGVPGGGTVSGTSSTATPLPASPAISLVKSAGAVVDANASRRVDAGDSITYSFAVRNTGTVSLDPVSVSDAKVGAVTCPTGPLAPDASVSCTAAPYAVTQADIDSGAVNNSASATGAAPAGGTVTASSSTSTPLPAAPSIGLVKSAGAVVDANASGRNDAGDTITYTFRVTNTGTVSMTSVSVADRKVGAVTCPSGSLEPSLSVTCTAAPYVVSQADVDGGAVLNTATATAVDPGGTEATADSSTSSPVTAVPSVDLVKSAGAVVDANANRRTDAGDTIAYGFAVKNTGNVTLDPVTVVDAKVGVVTCPAAPVAPGATVTCAAAAYVLTQADLDSGAANNTATATGVDPQGTSATGQSSTSTSIAASPSIGLVKSASTIVDANASGRIDAGDTITYGFAVTNTGTVSLDRVTVVDAKVGVVTCPSGPLAPGRSVSCTAASYVLTQADVDSGAVANTARSTAADPGGTSVSADSSANTPVAAAPSIGLVKNAGAVVDANGSGRADAGDTITYSFAVTNSGAVTLDTVAVVDAKVGAVTCPAGTLAPAATVTCTAEPYRLSQADVDSGAVNNTARATGVDPSGAETARQSSTSTPIAASPSIGLVKSAGAIVDANGTGHTDAGDTVNFSFAVTNSGTVSLDAVSVSDAMVGAVSCPPGVLAPDRTARCTAAPYVLTQADIDARIVQNTATAAGDPPSGAPVTAVGRADVEIPAPSTLELVKHAAVTDADHDGRTDLGDEIRWTFDVTNTGATTLARPTVSDPTAGTVTCPLGALAPGATVTCTADAAHTIVQSEVDAGAEDNTATAASSDPRTGAVVSPPSSTRTPVESLTAVAMEKHAELADTNRNGAADIGEHIAYTFVVTNTGTATLEDVAVNDPRLVAARLPITCPAGALAPRASVTCVAQDWIVTAADIANGDLIRNVATAQARPLGQLTTLASAPSVADVPTPKLAPKPAGLAFTGAHVGAAAGIMLALLAIGFALVLVPRRRRNRT